MASADSKLNTPLANCDTYPYTNEGETALSAGTFQAVGSILGILYEDLAVGASSVIITEAPAKGMKVPKATSLAISEGDVLYYDGENAVVNKTATNPFFGFATAAAGSSDTEVDATFAKTNPAVSA